MISLRVIVCGGRDYADYDRMAAILSALRSDLAPFEVIIHGAAKGADALAAKYAKQHQIPDIAFTADWRTLGPAAGPARNKRMLEEGKPDLVVAFPGGSGTNNMASQARAAGVKVVHVR